MTEEMKTVSLTWEEKDSIQVRNEAILFISIHCNDNQKL